MSKIMEISELKLILSELAQKDLSEGADIYDHPCSVAIREIDALQSQQKSAEKVRQGRADFYIYKINGAHDGISDTLPPDDSYDEGTLVALYTRPQPAQVNQQLLEALLEHFVAARFAIDTGMKGTALNCINAAIAAIAAAQENNK